MMSKRQKNNTSEEKTAILKKHIVEKASGLICVIGMIFNRQYVTAGRNNSLRMGHQRSEGLDRDSHKIIFPQGGLY